MNNQDRPESQITESFTKYGKDIGVRDLNEVLERLNYIAVEAGLLDSVYIEKSADPNSNVAPGTRYTFNNRYDAIRVVAEALAAKKGVPERHREPWVISMDNALRVNGYEFATPKDHLALGVPR